MLRWSGLKLSESDDAVAAYGGVGIDPIATGHGDAGLPFGRELVEFASAIAGFDELNLQAARARLVAVAGDVFMIDAAAVAANFEMMTRVADGTGARFDAAASPQRHAIGEQLGITRDPTSYAT